MGIASECRARLSRPAFLLLGGLLLSLPATVGQEVVSWKPFVRYFDRLLDDETCRQLLEAGRTVGMDQSRVGRADATPLKFRDSQSSGALSWNYLASLRTSNVSGTHQMLAAVRDAAATTSSRSP